MLGVVVFVLTVAGLVIPALVAGGVTVSPFSPAAAVVAYYTDHPFASTVNGLFLAASSVPLGIYAATAYTTLRRRGLTVPGPAIAFYGGVAAASCLAFSGFVAWTLGQSGVDQGALIHALAYLSYALGGVGFVGGLGLLIAGVAVPALIIRAVPRWFAWTGLVIAAISELSYLNLLTPAFGATLPLGRFLGLLWLLTAGFLLRGTHRTAISTRSER